MRKEILQYLKDQRLQSLNVSDELPFSNSGIILFLKNPKRIYVDLEQVVSEVFINTFTYPINAEVHSVKLYFTTDAKQLLSDYSEIVSKIRAGKDVPTAEYFHRREVISETSYENDMMVTQFEFRFTKLS